VLDCRAFGGQAGASARIENYLGFPTGITGMALMARAYNQAQKFGAEMAIPDEATGLELNAAEGAFVLRLFNAEQARARSIVIASGARYRRLNVANLEDFEASSVHYWASPLEGKLVAGQEVALGGKSLAASMSRYLVDRIQGLANVEVVTEAQVTGLEGRNGSLETLCWRRASGDEVRRPIRHLFLFIGAAPNSDWLSGALKLDAKGFVLTGAETGLSRQLLETSREGVFAIGDVRAGSVKRVAAAVGEGAQVVSMLHAYLAARDRQ
jgi:thioredoxin reductase (NADPH)